MRQINRSAADGGIIGSMLIFASSTKPGTATCPECKGPMMLARITPRLGGMAELHSFECKPCRNVLTRFADEQPAAGAATAGG